VRYPEAIVAVLDSADRPRKVVRLVTTRDGSFSIAAPYHPARSGTIAKIGAPPVVEPDGGGWSKPITPHRVDVRVKLTYHASGFVQFSSAERGKIRSGRASAREFYVPKGMGIHSHPLADPIETGPSCGITFFNVVECLPVDGTEKVPVLLFRNGDFFERDEHRSGFHHSYTISVFVFPPDVRREALFLDDRWVLHRAYSPLRPQWQVEFRVFELPTPLAFLGIVVERRHHLNTDDAPMGYIFSSPRDLGSQLWLTGHFPAGEGDDVYPSLAWPGSER
jgi:hypothetical protein